MRKEQITPIIPVPIELKTNHRARVRNEFDEMVKEKEREIERALEERKKELEAEEEKEVREIRRRAIPKAHDVPEWYREAPKRKREREGVE
jgi:predicted Holliday junction resolvase-like endonuclease